MCVRVAVLHPLHEALTAPPSFIKLYLAVKRFVNEWAMANQIATDALCGPGH
jgi:hypothetical protein